MPFPRPIHAVVFDMDGLLIDTEVGWRDAMIHVAAGQGRELTLATFQSMVGSPAARTREILYATFGADFDVETYLADAAARFHEVVDTEDLLKTGVVELLDYLDAVGIPKAIATSSQHSSVQQHLGPGGVAARFQAIIGSGDYANGKPSPDPFLVAAKALGVAPELCLALEDSHNGVRAAHAAGMMTVMVPDILEPTEEMREKCVHIAESLHRVRELVAASRA
jgi:HAD superfamily hydrolase (TIGR01509 family)